LTFFSLLYLIVSALRRRKTIVFIPPLSTKTVEIETRGTDLGWSIRFSG